MQSRTKPLRWPDCDLALKEPGPICMGGVYEEISRNTLHFCLGTPPQIQKRVFLRGKRACGSSDRPRKAWIYQNVFFGGKTSACGSSDRPQNVWIPQNLVFGSKKRLRQLGQAPKSLDSPKSCFGAGKKAPAAGNTKLGFPQHMMETNKKHTMYDRKLIKTNHF